MMTQSDNGTKLVDLYRTIQKPNAEIPPTMNPTHELSQALTRAYDYFNEELFVGKLPPCVLIVNRRSKRTYGHFIGDYWQDHQEANTTHELSLNPDHFHTRQIKDVLATLVHEQCHVQQHIYGKSGRGNYHNKQFAQMMKAVGLICSDTGEPGGKATGQRMSHYVEEGGAFERACDALLSSGFVIPWHTVIPHEHDTDDEDETAKKKLESKTKYSCPECSLNIWGKLGIHVLCMDCHSELVAEPS